MSPRPRLTPEIRSRRALARFLFVREYAVVHPEWSVRCQAAIGARVRPPAKLLQGRLPGRLFDGHGIAAVRRLPRTDQTRLDSLRYGMRHTDRDQQIANDRRRARESVPPAVESQRQR